MTAVKLGPPPANPVLPVDTIALLVEFLLACSAVTGLVGQNIGVELTGADREIRVQRTGGTSPRGNPVLIDQALYQIDCYADSSVAAAEVCRTVAAVLPYAPGHPLTAGVVSMAEVFASRNLTDSETIPVRHRWMLDARLTVHPHR